MRTMKREYYKQAQQQLKDYGKLLHSIALCQTQLDNMQESTEQIAFMLYGIEGMTDESRASLFMF